MTPSIPPPPTEADPAQVYRLHCFLLGACMVLDAPADFGPCDDPDLEWVRICMQDTRDIDALCTRMRRPIARLGGPGFLTFCIELYESVSLACADLERKLRGANALLLEADRAEESLMRELARVKPFRDRFQRAKDAMDRWLANSLDEVRGKE